MAYTGFFECYGWNNLNRPRRDEVCSINLRPNRQAPLNKTKDRYIGLY